MRILSYLLLITILVVAASFKKPEATTNLPLSTTFFIPDTSILPKVDSNYAVKLLIPGEFQKKDLNYDANTYQWFALVGNGKTFSIRKFQPEMTAAKDASGADVFTVKGHDSLNTILMTSGVELLEKEVIEMKLGNKSFKVGDRLELNYNGKKFVMTADGDERKDKKTKKNYIENYRLYIAPLKKEDNKTLLSYHKRVDDVFPKIIFMGDMDNDKKPDLILNNTNSATENHLTLFLTNNSPKGSMYKVMGVFNYSK